MPRVHGYKIVRMFIYNLTTKIDNDIEMEWLRWQKETFIPAIMNTGLFYDLRFFKLLGQDESDGKTFIIQFYAEKKSLYEAYIIQHSERFIKKTINRWGGKFLVFQSLLESVQ